MTDIEKLKEDLKTEILKEIAKSNYQSTINAKTKKEARNYFFSKMSKREHDDFRHQNKYRNAVSAFANMYMVMYSSNECRGANSVRTVEDSELYLFAYKRITDDIAKLFYD